MNQLISSLEDLTAPQYVLAALELLQFQNPSVDRLDCLSDGERGRFLEWCDVRQLTLLLAEVCRSPLPAWVAEPMMQKTARYEPRFKRLKQQLFEIVEAFNAAALEFVMLKGLSHAPAFTPDARLRAQGDIDLWLIGPSVYKGQDVLRSLGYVPQLASKSRHLSPMSPPSTWRWRGDLFDSEMPVSVELHYELWSEDTEYIVVPDLNRFWDRKQVCDFDGHNINVLCDADLLGFATLHLLLHLLHGDLPLQRAWEIARFLDTHVTDEAFWASWSTLHPAALRQLETSVFYLVTSWFGCHARKEPGVDIEKLPAGVRSWLKTFSLAPITREWAANKSETWLHLALIHKPKDKARVLFRRLLPTSMPCFADRASPETSRLGKLLMHVRQLRLLATRLVRHVVTFFPTIFDGLRWFWLSKS